MKVSQPELHAHVVKWSQHPFHVGAEWLPKFVYHFTDLNNAVDVLKRGELLCRNEAVRLNVMRHDNASAQVIANTKTAHCDFARLYFRPRTPTQYYNEGIRPLAERGLDGAHCPVPVFFGFDLVETIGLPGVLFSNGNMAKASVEYGDSATLFSQIPFDLVYHEGPIDDSLRQRNIVFHRHAEVLAPRSLGLSTLRWIGCRSHAERESLLMLLGLERSKWEHMIGVGERLFLRRGAFVESASLDGSNVMQFAMHVPSGWVLCVRFEAIAAGSGKTWRWQSDAWAPTQLALNLRGMEPGTVRLFIEDCLAYTGWAQPADDPF
jgi:hypothetical protein